jgi:hypothetical protein
MSGPFITPAIRTRFLISTPRNCGEQGGHARYVIRAQARASGSSGSRLWRRRLRHNQAGAQRPAADQDSVHARAASPLTTGRYLAIGAEIAHLQFVFRKLTLAICSGADRSALSEIEIVAS